MRLAARSVKPVREGVSATWALTTVDTNLGGIQNNPNSGSSASLAFSATGAPSIAYRDDQGTALRYAQCAAGNCGMASGWSTSLVDSGDVGEFPSLALSPAAGSLNQPRITYRDGNNGNLKLASMTASGWQVTTLDGQSGARLSSLKLTASDGVRASYNSNNGNGLRYIFFGP